MCRVQTQLLEVKPKYRTPLFLFPHSRCYLIHSDSSNYRIYTYIYKNHTMSVEDKVADMKRKLSIIKTIVKKCGDLRKNPVNLADPLVATMFLTNEPRQVIEEAIATPKVIELNRMLAINENLKRKTEKCSIQSYEIHEILYENYVGKRKLLNIHELQNEVAKLCQVENLMDVLKTRGFIWKKLCGNKCILVEDPEVQAKRVKYLLDMKRLREKNTIFVFVEHKAIPADTATLNKFNNKNMHPESGTYQYIKVAASPQLGFMSVSNNPSETFSDWLTQEVTLYTKNPFVVVMNEKAINEDLLNQPPNPEAKKEDMMDWLERNDIPCSSNMHRAELYELIDTYRDKLSGEKTFTEEILEGHNVKLLKVPDGWPMLNYFAPLWDKKILWNSVEEDDILETLIKRVEILLESWNLSKFQDLDNELDGIETNLYDKDMELEEVIDKLFTMAQDVTIPDVNLSNCGEVEYTDMEQYVKLFSGTLTTQVKQISVKGPETNN